MPEGSAAWLELNRLRLGSFNVDLSSSEALGLLAFWNHDWASSDDWWHWCLGCCSSEQHSFERARYYGRVACCLFPGVPLLYRWKYWEEATSYWSRGFGVHSMLPETFAFMHVHRAVAAPDLRAAAAGNGGDDEESFATRQYTRELSCLGFMRSAAARLVGHRASLISQPLAAFITAGMSLDTRHKEFHMKSRGLKTEDVGGEEDLESCGNKLLDECLAFMVGDRGRLAVRRYTAVLFRRRDSRYWVAIGIHNIDDMELVAVDNIVTLADTWRRCVFVRMRLPWDYFYVAACANVAEARELGLELRRKGLRCQGCVDKMFSEPMIEDLCSDSDATVEQNVEVTKDIVKTFRCSNGACERLHLLSTHTNKLRGKRAGPMQIAADAYVLACNQQHASLKKSVDFTHNIDRATRLLQSYSIGGAGRQSSEASHPCERASKRARRTPCDGRHVFMREKKQSCECKSGLA